ncbi:phosphoesterase family-domain-containing protein [Mycena filopes]|nr:phosphoesterase family-domain-containing protein [Mycena filopes]
MSLLLLAIILASSVRLATAARAQVFVPPSKGPLVQSGNYTSFSNNTLDDKDVIPGKAFDRIIQIWLENTDFETAISTPTFAAIAEQGILFTNSYAVTHPSEPNYVAAIGGDFFGMHVNKMYHIPANISCVVDLLEDKNISWATYQENMPTDGFYGSSYSAPDYISPSSGRLYPYYLRKHNPLIIYDAVSQSPRRTTRIRTFNDFANDVVNGTLPQWVFVTPNMVNDAHDTTIDFSAAFLEYWLLPLMVDPRVNDDRTLILLTFDENDSYGIQNRVFSVALGGAVPEHLRGTEDDTLYTHYSSLSTVQANWGLKSLGRQDTNPIVSNVFSFVAAQTGYQNTHVPASQIPEFNLTGAAPGPLSSTKYVPFAAPDLNARGPVHTRPGLDVELTRDRLPPAVDLRLTRDEASPWQMSPRSTGAGDAIVPCADYKCA